MAYIYMHALGAFGSGLCGIYIYMHALGAFGSGLCGIYIYMHALGAFGSGLCGIYIHACTRSICIWTLWHIYTCMH